MLFKSSCRLNILKMRLRALHQKTSYHRCEQATCNGSIWKASRCRLIYSFCEHITEDRHVVMHQGPWKQKLLCAPEWAEISLIKRASRGRVDGRRLLDVWVLPAQTRLKKVSGGNVRRQRWWSEPAKVQPHLSRESLCSYWRKVKVTENLRGKVASVEQQRLVFIYMSNTRCSSLIMKRAERQLEDRNILK